MTGSKRNDNESNGKYGGESGAGESGGGGFPGHYEDDALDSVLAERFQLLERVTPPDSRGPVDPVLAMSAEPSTAGGRSRFVLAVAASAVVLLGAMAAFVAGQGDDDSLAVAGEDTSTESDADESSDSKLSESADKRVDSAVPALSVTTDSVSDKATTTSPETDSKRESDKKTDDSDLPETSRVDTSDSTVSAKPTTVTKPDDNNDTTEPGADSSTTTAEESTTTKQSPPVETSPPYEESLGFFSGVVTEVFTDCQSRQVLNDQGKVESIGPVSCDGGSYIVLDGVRIFTSAGFVSQDLYYDKHPTYLLPGQRATATASASSPGGPLTLACDECGIRIG